MGFMPATDDMFIIKPLPLDKNINNFNTAHVQQLANGNRPHVYQLLLQKL